MSSPKMGSNESGYLSLSNGESNALCGSSKASSIWGDKSLWNLSNSPNSTSSMQMNGVGNEGKDSFWHSSTSSPISTPSQFNHHNSVWGCSPIKEDDSLGSIWNIPKQQQQDGNFEAPLPPHSNYIQKTQPQLLRPQDIGGSTWSGMNNNNNNTNSHHNNSNIVNKMKEPVGALWAHPTPPNMQLNLQTQNYNLLQSSNSKFQSPMKPMGAIHSNGLNCNNNNIQMGGNISVNNSTSASNMQLFSDEFLSYLNMIN